MLNGTLELHDIQDVAAFTAAIIRKTGLELRREDREDLHQTLIFACWKLSRRYQPGGITFSTYATHTLTRRIDDWIRQHNGRTLWAFRDRVYERTIPVQVGYDERDHMGADDAVSAGRDPTDRVATSEGIEHLRDRLRAQHARILSQALEEQIAA